MFLDLDNFKPLNDTYGHEVGDFLLIEVARRLNGCVREMDTVARYGGDEFVVIVGELEADRDESTQQAFLVAEKIRNALAEPYRLPLARGPAGEAALEETLEYHCTASIGLTVFSGDDSLREEILKWADAAMYQAKVRGNNSVQISTKMSGGCTISGSLASTFIHLVWHSAYECGNAVIDEQHRSLFADANRILSAVLAERPVNELAELIDHLMGDVVRHFKDEEAIIATAGFPGTAEHRAIHSQLLDRALKLVGRFHAGTLEVGELFQFLGYDLVAQHMLSADREFFSVLRGKGRKAGNERDFDPIFAP
ncbi:MAG: diguanylate cyclase [Propionivibrio sp.]